MNDTIHHIILISYLCRAIVRRYWRLSIERLGETPGRALAGSVFMSIHFPMMTTIEDTMEGNGNHNVSATLTGEAN